MAQKKFHTIPSIISIIFLIPKIHPHKIITKLEVALRGGKVIQNKHCNGEQCSEGQENNR